MTTTTRASTAGRALLADFVTRAELATEWNCHERTIARYETATNGLPFLFIGGRKLYRIEDARRFMEGRIVTPNPVRRGAAR